MQVLCIASNDNAAEIACPICGQHYAVYYSRPFGTGVARTRSRPCTLRSSPPSARHRVPQPTRPDCFNVPEWEGPGTGVRCGTAERSPGAARSGRSCVHDRGRARLLTSVRTVCAGGLTKRGRAHGVMGKRLYL